MSSTRRLSTMVVYYARRSLLGRIVCVEWSNIVCLLSLWDPHEKEIFFRPAYARKWILQSKYNMESHTWLPSCAMHLPLAMEEVTHAYQRAKFGVPFLGRRQNGNGTPLSGFLPTELPRQSVLAHWLLGNCPLPYPWRRGTSNTIRRSHIFQNWHQDTSSHRSLNSTSVWNHILSPKLQFGNWNLFYFIDLNQPGITCLSSGNQICRDLATWHNHAALLARQ